MKNEKKMQSALIITVRKRENPNLGYHISREGAKIYDDINRHPVLLVTEERKHYHVLSFGQHNDNQTSCTVMENGIPVCYRMPKELNDWVMSVVNDVLVNGKDFPEDCVFYKENGKICADIS